MTTCEGYYFLQRKELQDKSNKNLSLKMEKLYVMLIRKSLYLIAIAWLSN